MALEAGTIINGLAILLLTIVGFSVKQLLNRIKDHENKTQERFDASRIRHDNDIKALYKNSNNLSKDINNLATSLRKEISDQAAKTNVLLLQLVAKTKLE